MPKLSAVAYLGRWLAINARRFCNRDWLVAAVDAAQVVVKIYEDWWQMFEYKFVQCPVKYSKGQTVRSYEEVVHEHAKQGWRLVQIFVEIPAAMPSEYQLIFEKPIAIE